jgi:hypothetical protein
LWITMDMKFSMLWLLKIKDFLKCHKKRLHSWKFCHVFWTYFFCYSRYLQAFMGSLKKNGSYCYSCLIYSFLWFYWI